jgi:hypothetical protein
MKVKVKFWGIPGLLSFFKGKKELQMDFIGETVKDLIHHLSLKVGPKERGFFVNDQGEISPDLFVFINGKWFSGSNRFSQRLRENDLIELTLAAG